MSSSRLQGLMLLGAIALLGGCASAVNWPATEPGPQAVVPPAATGSIGALAARAAATVVGAPYHFGGTSPRGFDCSGLVYFAYGRAGVHVPRTTSELYRRAQPVPLEALLPGDLLFFHFDRKVGHVAIYTGGNQFIHAPSSGKSVMRGTLDDDFWRDRLVSARRLIL